MPRINPYALDKSIRLPNQYTKNKIVHCIKEWFLKNGLTNESKYVETANGLKIHFTGISEWHFPVDVVTSSRKDIALKTIPYLPEVFATGKHKAIQALTKDRSQKRANFILFHIFEKKIRIDNYWVTVRAKAGEYPNGKIVLLPFLSAYTFTMKKVSKTTEGEKKESVADLLDNPYQSPKRKGLGHIQKLSASLRSATLDNATDLLDSPEQSRKVKGGGHIQTASASLRLATQEHNNLYLDDVQDDFLSTFDIIAIEPIPTTDIYRKQINALFRRYGL